MSAISRVWFGLVAVLLLASGVQAWRVVHPSCEERGWTQLASAALYRFAQADSDLGHHLLASAWMRGAFRPAAVTEDIARLRRSASTMRIVASHRPALMPFVRRLSVDADARTTLATRILHDSTALRLAMDRPMRRGLIHGEAREAMLVWAGELRLMTGVAGTGTERRQPSRRSTASDRALAGGTVAETRRAAARAADMAAAFNWFEAINTGPDIAAALAVQDGMARDEIATHRRQELILAALIALSVAALCATAARFYLRIGALRRQRDHDALDVAISELLLDVSHGALPSKLQGVLAHLATHIEADRAFLLLETVTPGAILWCRAGTFTADHAHAIVQAATMVQAWKDDRISVARSRRAWGWAHRKPASRAASPNSILLARSPDTEDACVLGFQKDRASIRLSSKINGGLTTVIAAILQSVRRDELEGERIAAEDSLARARRMEIVGALASGIAHNFNNILGAITGFAETAELHLLPNSSARTSTGEIRKAAKRGHQLVDRILTFGRRSEVRRETVAIGALLTETVGLLRATLPAGVRIEAMGDAYCYMVEADAAQLQQVLLNLCNNAALAMAEGGVIHYHAERQVLETNRQLSHGSLGRGSYVVISIRDSGVGIPQLALSRLFEPFYTTRQRGTGLGLSTAWEIVQDHGGTIDVSSRPGAGSRFAIWLPATHGSVPSRRVAQRGDGEPVLIIHHDPERLSNDEELIAMLGYEPVVTPDIPGHADTAGYLATIEVRPDPGVTGSNADARLQATLRPSQTSARVRLRYPLQASEVATALAACRTSQAVPAAP